jgi:hypothetical protein
MYFFSSLFLNIDSLDIAGHESYWGSPFFYEMAKEKDRHVAGILDALAATKTSSGNAITVNCV